MSESSIAAEREEIRYELQGTILAAITFEPFDPDDPEAAISAHVINLSQGGVRLSTPVALPLRKGIRLRLRIEELALEFYVSAEVCWCRPNESGAHLVGCRFTPGIPAPLLGRLASGGMIDRRMTARSKVALELRMTTEEGGREKSVILQNHSPGGFCILVRSPMEPGTRLSLSRKGDRQPFLTGRVRWRLQSSQVYLVGCVFENSAVDV